jgi:hypothetical protein
MKKILLLLLLPLTVLAQSFDAHPGKILDGSELRDMFQTQPGRVKLRNGSSMGRLSFFDAVKGIGYQGFGFSSRKGFEIGEFHNYVDFTGTKMLSSEVEVSENQRVYIHGFLNITNNFFILYSVNDKGNNEERVYVNQLSSEMVMLGNPVLLITFEEKKDSFAPLYFTSSPDKKSFAVVREYLHRGITEKVQIKAFGQGLNELYKASIDVSKRQELFVLNDVAIANNHNLYLFGGVDPKADNLVVFAGAKNKAVPYMMAYSAKSKEVKQIEISQPEIKQYYDFKFFLTEDNEPAAVSVYKSGRAVGYSVYHLNNQSLDINWKYTGTLSPEAYSITKKYKSEREFLDVVSFTKLHSGEYTFSLESNFLTANNTRSFSNSGSIILIGLNQKGSMLWEKIIYKHQRIPDTKLHSSHTAFATDSGLLIVFNDDAKNLSLSPSRPKFSKLKKTKNAMAVGVEVNPNGEMKKFPLLKGQSWHGFTLDMYHFPEIKKELYQFRLSKYGGFGKFETAYGKLQL